MFKITAWLAVAAFLVLSVGAKAEEIEAGDGSFYERTSGPWEFGLDLGMGYGTKKNSFSHVIDNQRAYDLLAGEPIGDEVAEGWVPPPLPGNSTVAATLTSSADLGMHLYRRWTPWFSSGLDLGFLFKREAHVDDPGIYPNANFLALIYNTSILHASFPGKFGPEYGSFRPYLLAGPGVYIVQERAQISFTDPDDPQLGPIDIIHRDHLCFGVNGGAGIEQRVGKGLIGLEVQYHKIFAGRDRVDFILPRLRFAVQF